MRSPAPGIGPPPSCNAVTSSISIFGINWCPFDRLSHIPSSFEEGELPPSVAYQDIFGNFLFTEQPPSYLGMLQPSAPSASHVLPENPLNSASYHHHHHHRRRHWGHVPSPAGVPRHGRPNNDTQFHPWEHHSFRPGLVDGPRPNPNPDGLTPRTILFGPPPAADGSAARAGGVFVLSANPRFFGGSRGAASGGHEGFQHRAPPVGRRSAMVLPIGPPPPPPQSDEAGFYLIFPPDTGSIVGPREVFAAAPGPSAVGGRSGSRHQYGAQRQHPQDHATDDVAHPQQPYYHHFM